MEPTNKPHGKKFKFRIGQFNLLNMAKEGEKYYDSKYSKETVDKKVAWTTEQLKKMKAQIVGFEELWHPEVLQRCIDGSGLYEGAKVIAPGADGSGPKVALISAYPVKEVVSITDFPKDSLLKIENAEIPIKTFNRPVLKAVISLPTGHDITVFVVHLKSKRPIMEGKQKNDQKATAVGHALSVIMRSAESAALRCIVIDEIKIHKRPVFVLGDLNDVVHSVSTEIVTGTVPFKFLPRPQKDEIWETLLHSTNEAQVRVSDRDVTYSHIFNGRYDVLDHILVSQDFVRGNPKHIGYIQYIQLFNDHLVDETLTDEKRDLTQSDHGQVVAAIAIYNGEKEKHK